MITFIKAKLKKSDDQTSIDIYRLAANITEYHIISWFSKGLDLWRVPVLQTFSWITVAECALRIGRNYDLIKNVKIACLKWTYGCPSIDYRVFENTLSKHY